MNEAEREKLADQFSQKERENREVVGFFEFSDRGLVSYEKILGFSREQLRGKKVLDIGSGFRESFAKQAEECDIEVVNLNPNLKDGLNTRTQYGSYREHHGQSVAGFAQRLPFKDESFDEILALASVPQYTNPEDYIEEFNEIYRVLKKDGHFRSAPFVLLNFQITEFGEAMRKLQEMGAEVGIQPLKPEEAEEFQEMGPIIFRLIIKK